MRYQIRAVAAIFLCCFCLGTNGLAQVINATLSGTVSDNSVSDCRTPQPQHQFGDVWGDQYEDGK